MSSLQRRTASLASMTANLVVQLRDLDLLREQVVKISTNIETETHEGQTAGHFVPRTEQRRAIIDKPAGTKRDKPTEAGPGDGLPGSRTYRNSVFPLGPLGMLGKLIHKTAERSVSVDNWGGLTSAAVIRSSTSQSPVRERVTRRQAIFSDAAV